MYNKYTLKMTESLPHRRITSWFLIVLFPFIFLKHNYFLPSCYIVILCLIYNTLRLLNFHNTEFLSFYLDNVILIIMSQLVVYVYKLPVCLMYPTTFFIKVSLMYNLMLSSNVHHSGSSVHDQLVL